MGACGHAAHCRPDPFTSGSEASARESGKIVANYACAAVGAEIHNRSGSVDRMRPNCLERTVTDVFIGYAREDLQRVKPLVEALEERDGLCGGIGH